MRTASPGDFIKDVMELSPDFRGYGQQASPAASLEGSGSPACLPPAAPAAKQPMQQGAAAAMGY
jgi:hypothetical protein